MTESGSEACLRCDDREGVVSTASDDLVILHVSDTHFGQPDRHYEMKRITDALIDAVHQQELAPDLCVFSGDLSFSGTDKENADGRKWLEELLRPWPDARLFVVPGNHDVVRSDAKAILRQVCDSEALYQRDQLSPNVSHLAKFFACHAALKGLFGSRLLSDWSKPFGCIGNFKQRDRPIRLVGLNTSLLSCYNDDRGKLVQDIAALNEHLGGKRSAAECVISVGHHPFDWLVPWNQAEVEKLLRQQTGAHLYLHGHRHEQASTTAASGTGEKLCILECGAAYQGSKWPQFFSFYTLRFSQRDILPAVFLYSPGSGKWVKDNTRSEPIVAPLPPPSPAPPQPAAPAPRPERGGGRAGPVVAAAAGAAAGRRKNAATTRTAVTAVRDDDSDRNKMEVDAYRVRGAANGLYSDLRIVMDSSLARIGELFGHSSRVKEQPSIIRKVLERRRTENGQYSVADVDDIIGFRYSTLFQSDLPLFVGGLLGAAFDGQDMFRIDQGAKVTVYTSRADNDALNMVDGIKRALQDWGGHYSLEIRPRSAAQSSVEIVLRHTTARWAGDQDGLPVEFELGHGLEEFWVQVDRQLRYQLNRGGVGDIAWQRHLNLLKSQFDGAILGLDVIKEALQQGDGASKAVKLATTKATVARKGRSSRSFSSLNAQLERLAGLPAEVYLQVKGAFALWEEADASQQFGGDPNKFRRAADAFRDLPQSAPRLDAASELGKRFLYIARMEQAYLLLCTSDKDDVELAGDIYRDIVNEYPDDAAALLRQGQVCVRLGKIDDAIMYFDRAVEGRLKDAWQEEETAVHDFARLNRALGFFRKFENSERSAEERRDSIKKAIELSKEILEPDHDETMRREVLNNLVYFAWEERRFIADESVRSLSEQEYRELAGELIKALTSDEIPSFREADTLVRIYLSLDDDTKAREVAGSVCLLLERAAQVRSGGLRTIAEDRFSTRWVAQVIEWLIDQDERDALLFSVELVNKPEPA